MSFTEATGDGFAVYSTVMETTLDAEAITAALEGALGLTLQGPEQDGHVVTGKIAYTEQSIVQVRIPENAPPLTAAQKKAALAALSPS